MVPMGAVHISCNLVRLADITPLPWKNGGGHTRELLAWPDAVNWDLRISVAEIRQSGPFSAFPGVDRWIAVLSGAGISLETVGKEAQELNTAQLSLHAFSGDAHTQCTALGTVTQDFNVMWLRAKGRLQQQSLQQMPMIDTTAAMAALFVVRPVTVTATSKETWQLPALSLAWWPNPRRQRRLLQTQSEELAVRGWWLEADC